MSRLLLRVYYEDTDAGGVVYHANHIKYFERGRTEWLSEQGFEQDALMRDDLCFVVSSLNIHYSRPAFFNQRLTVVTHVQSHKRASIVFHQYIEDEQGQIIAKGDVVVACVRLSTKKPCALPATLLEEVFRAS